MKTASMAHGELVERRLEYALGVFNGPRRSFQDYNSAKDLFTLFQREAVSQTADGSPLQQLNLGGSFNCGDELNPLQPAAFRTANDQSPSATAAECVAHVPAISIPTCSKTAGACNGRAIVTWYYKSFGFMAGYQGGFQTYGLSTGGPDTPNFIGVDQRHANCACR